MTAERKVDVMLDDCFLALGQGVGDDKAAEYEAIVWWSDRYREKFRFAVNELGNSWEADRDRVLAVSRWLGQRARFHAGGRESIGFEAAALASTDVETGCRMSKERNA